MEKKEIINKNIKCECGYQNHPENIQKYGNCRGCGKIIDERAHYKYEMFKRLNLWRYNKNKRNLH